MKPKINGIPIINSGAKRFRRRTIGRNSLLAKLVFACVVLFGLRSNLAVPPTSGTWADGTTGGMWSNTANWTGGTIADGPDAVADFSTLNITADNTVHLDSPRTVGNLLFGDATPSNNWTLDNNGSSANMLTMAVSTGNPTITVNNQTATIGALLAGNQGLTIAGSGTLALNGATANSYTGATVVSGGKLTEIMSNMATPTNLIGASSALTMAGGQFLLTGKSTGTSSQSFNGTTIGLGPSSISASNNGGSGTTLALGAIAHLTGGTVDFTLPGGNGKITTTTGNTNGILGGWATVGGTDWATVSGGNMAALSSYASNWTSGNNTSVNATGFGGSVTNSLRFNVAAAYTVSLPTIAIIQSGGILEAASVGGSTTTISSGSLTSGNGTDLIVNQFDTAAAMKITSDIVDNGFTPIGLTKSGGGTLTLTSTTSTFSGPVTINAGTLALSPTTEDGVRLHAVTIASGASLTGASFGTYLGSLSGGGTITAPTTVYPIFVGADNSNTTFSGTIGSGVELVKQGNGTLTLAGNNTSTGGGVTLRNGNLILDYTSNTSSKVGLTNSFVLDEGTVTIVPNSAAANLTIGGNVNLPQSYSGGQGGVSMVVANTSSSASIALGAISRGGGTSLDFVLPANFAGHLTTNNANTNGILGGWATVNGTDWAANSAPSGIGNVIAFNAYTPFVSANSSPTTNYLLSGSAALSNSESLNSLKIVDTGPGQLLDLGGSNLTIPSTGSNSTSCGGILYAGGASNSYTVGGSGVLSSNGELFLNVATGATLTINAPIAGATQWFTKSGAGTLILGGNNLFNAPIAINSGTVKLASTTALRSPNGSLVIGFGATLDLNGYSLPVGPYTIQVGGNGAGGAGEFINSSTTPVNLVGTAYGLTFLGDVTIGGSGDIHLGTFLYNFQWGANALTKIGSGILSMSTATFPTNGTNTLIIAGGTFQYQGDNVVNSEGAVFVGPGTIYDLNGHTDTIATLNLNNGTVTLGSGTNYLRVSRGNPTSVTATGTSSITGTNSGFAVTSGNVNVVNPNDVLNITAPLVDGNYYGALTKAGAGRLILSGIGSFTGATAVLAGTLELGGNAPSGANGTLGNATSVVLLGDTSGSSNATLIVNGPYAVGRNITAQAGNSGVVTLGGTNTMGTANYTGNMTLNHDVNVTSAAGGNVQFATGGVSGSGGINGSGGGVVVFAGVDTYTGVTRVTSGTLQFAKQVSLYNNSTGSWTATNIIVNNGTTLALNVGGTGEFTAANVDTLKALGNGAGGGFQSGSILALDTTNAVGGNFFYGSAIGNPNGGVNILGLTKLGNGTLTLSNANTYTGSTMVTAGTLNVTGSLANNGSSKVAVAPNTSSGFIAPGPTITRTIAAGHSYAGYGSAITSDLLTSADIRAGKNVGGVDSGVTMQWRAPSAAELPNSSQGNFGLISDAVDVTGMVNSGAAAGQTDPFALQMSYSPLESGPIQLDWLNPDGNQPNWQNAVSGNLLTGTSVFTNVPLSWDSFASLHGITEDNVGNFLGSWGVDTTNHIAWAIVDHNSQFAVATPEPSTLVLGLLGLLGFGLFARQKMNRVAQIGFQPGAMLRGVFVAQHSSRPFTGAETE